MDWFLYDNGLCHERVKYLQEILTGLLLTTQWYCVVATKTSFGK